MKSTNTSTVTIKGTHNPIKIFIIILFHSKQCYAYRLFCLCSIIQKAFSFEFMIDQRDAVKELVRYSILHHVAMVNLPFWIVTMGPQIYSVDLEVWSKLAERARIKRTASKCAHDFDCDWECVNAFSHCGTLTRVLLLQIISCSDTKVLILSCYGIQAYKYVLLCTVYELIYLLHTSRSTEYRSICFIYKWE